MPESLDLAVRIAARLNHLFATKLSPRGRPYTLREVAEATGGRLAIPYISLLRKGGVERPGADKLQALADFFGVSVAYLAGQDVPQEPKGEVDAALLAQLEKPLMREVVFRAGALNPEERALMLQMLEYSQRIAAVARAQESVREDVASSMTLDDTDYQER